MLKQTINWNDPQLISAPRKAQPNKRETKFEVVCTTCGYRRWLTRSHAATAERDGGCYRCASVERGRKGAAVTMSRYGRSFLLDILAGYQTEHPSRPENAVREYLESKGIPHDRQYIYYGRIRNYVLDFVVCISDKMVAIEVNGSYYHNQRPERDLDLVNDFEGDVIAIEAEKVFLPGYLSEVLGAIC